MKLEFLSKSLDHLNNEPYRTRVVLGNADGSYYPVFFDKEAIHRSDADLYLEALERVYQENFPHRAEEEKFRTLEEAISNTVAELERFREEALAEVTSEVDKNREMVKIVSLMMNTVLAKVAIDDEEEIDELEAEEESINEPTPPTDDHAVDIDE